MCQGWGFTVHHPMAREVGSLGSQLSIPLSLESVAVRKALWAGWVWGKPQSWVGEGSQEELTPHNPPTCLRPPQGLGCGSGSR
jgi:hypothetical protein